MDMKVSFDQIKSYATQLPDTVYFTCEHQDLSATFEVAVRTFLPIEQKLMLVQDVIENSKLIDDVTQLPYIDKALEKIFFDVMLVAYYTNIELGEDMAQSHDMLSASNLIKDTRRFIPSNELSLLEEILNRKVETEREMMQRSVSTGYVLSTLMSNFDAEKFEEGLEKLKSFDPAKLEQLTELKKFVTEPQPQNRQTRRSNKKKKESDV